MFEKEEMGERQARNKKAWRRPSLAFPPPFRLVPPRSKGLAHQTCKVVDVRRPERYKTGEAKARKGGERVRENERGKSVSCCLSLLDEPGGRKKWRATNPQPKKIESKTPSSRFVSLIFLSFSLSSPPSAMADPHPTTATHRPPAAIELSNVSTFVELLSALPPPVAPVPGGVPRPPSAIGDAAAVERLSGDEAALARMRAALAGVRQVPYM